MQTLNEAKRLFERDYLRKLLKATNADIPKAAVIAGRSRTKFYTLLKRHGFVPAEYRRKEE